MEIPGDFTLNISAVEGLNGVYSADADRRNNKLYTARRNMNTVYQVSEVIPSWSSGWPVLITILNAVKLMIVFGGEE